MSNAAEKIKLQEIMDELNRSIRESVSKPLDGKPTPGPWPAVDTTDVFDAKNYLERLLDTSLGPWAQNTLDVIDGIRKSSNATFARLVTDEDGYGLVIHTCVTVPQVVDNMNITFTL